MAKLAVTSLLGSTMKRLVIGCASGVIVVALVAAFLFSTECRKGFLSECNYKKIKIGMTVGEAEAILGPSQELGWEWVPRSPDGPVISGERFFKWEDGKTGRKVWVGVRSGRICNQWYWEPSL